ncbi:hypothetical protein [Rhizobium lentis]|uniref:hypothetical protein n=1 Tax=Rhizobium lentis TaxID=1138194 RepID=UPI001A914083|nr:hypothetical protein [Rhizobium lentis]MBX4997061.1 hypothetical protein [Rhizobium lentis]MBX5018562.1 hypothetical protein [Rhizobium lentis]MBX5065053.1 hypothetical protein [Rhizobium lentis]MBX5077123.1 hypothetical protein [Rhizobium lentis]QSW96833.1 hypothetical protein J0663_28000 [Rhizobium lentis]
MEKTSEHTLETVHRDLALANAYRQEFIKTLILVAGALFAFSVSFRPQLQQPVFSYLFWISWIALAASMVGGFGQLAAWERIYASYQRFERKGLDGDQYRDALTKWRRVALFVQMVGFTLGVSALGAFTAFNLSHVVNKS